MGQVVEVLAGMDQLQIRARRRLGGQDLVIANVPGFHQRPAHAGELLHRENMGSDVALVRG